ncbi:hypothetical protein HRbin33_00076 [bacterium HR33]|nr:hypothetical protein HRbin33_00076 [bacterium HR33]
MRECNLRKRCLGAFWPLAVALAGLVSAPKSAGGQGILEQFSYEGLRLSGVGLEIGPQGSDRLVTELSGAVRVDYGFIAPNVRVLLGAGYFRAAFEPDEIEKFETRLRGVVNDPTGDFTIDVGEITWTTVTADLDLQYLFRADRLTTYLGVGLGAHIRDGDGRAIEGTFVEDALDTIQAGINLSLGAAVDVLPRLQVTLDLRGVLTSELRTASARGGLMFRLGVPGR